MAKPLESTTDAGIGTRLELTRTVSEGSTSSLTVRGRESFAGVCGLELGVPEDWLGSAAGSGPGLRFAGEGFAALSVFRPDCAITIVGTMKLSSKKTIDTQRIFERSCGFMRKPEEPAIESVEAKCPILSALVRPEVDVGLVFYVRASDLVPRAALAKQR